MPPRRPRPTSRPPKHKKRTKAEVAERYRLQRADPIGQATARRKERREQFAEFKRGRGRRDADTE